MRLFFIPGLGEEPSIFNKIHPYLPGEKVFIDNWTLLAVIPEKETSVTNYAEYLVRHFDITAEDTVIGHSMGGWIALALKQITGCKVIQVASWTNGKKVITVPLGRETMYLFAKQGWPFNEAARKVIVMLYYRNKPSREVFIPIFERIRTGNKQIVAKQLMIVYNPPRQPITVSPDLRIHARFDHIIQPPDEPFVEVPGDHFSLYTYPETVYGAIRAFLQA